ncbi:MAG: biotin-dependent carboxyltransferase family protein [Bellilinea sp.]|jgi:antagonist of KipI
MAIEVLEGGLLASVQDLGRTGWAKFGVPRSGAMDEFALRAANRLVGNPDSAAGIEIGPAGFKFRLSGTAVIAVCGADFTLSVDGESKPLWKSIFTRNGQIIEIQPNASGVWAEIACSGGVQVPLLMHSRSTYLRGGFGGYQGRTLQSGDSIQIGGYADRREFMPCWLPPAARPRYHKTLRVRVVEDGQHEFFSPQTRQQFYQQAYTVNPASDRVGYRLISLPLPHDRVGEMLSAGMLPGTIQVAADRQPMVMMADSPPSGGYPRIAAVIRADLGLMAQCPPGSGQVYFQPVEVSEAHQAYRSLLECLNKIESLDDEHVGTEWAGATR